MKVRDLLERGPRHGVSPPLRSTPLPPQRPGRCHGSRVAYVATGRIDAFGEPDDVIEVACRGCVDCRRAA